MMKKVVCFIKGPGNTLKCCYTRYLKKPSTKHNMRTNTQLDNIG